MKYDKSILNITNRFAELYAALNGLPNMQMIIDDGYDRFLNHEKLPSIKIHDAYKEVYRTKIQEMMK